MIRWHLVLDGRCPSTLNMARDAALFQSLIEKRYSGILRIYNWDEPAVTIGYHQKGFTLSDPNLTLPVLKRPTGGGAVLHMDDITFSLCVPSSGPFDCGVLAACGAVSGIFGRALESCGLKTEMKGGPIAFSDVCFMRSTPVELHFMGNKILGLALLRRRGCILFQGVMPLRTDRDLSIRVFGEENDPGTPGILDRAPEFDEDEFMGHLLDAFSSRMGISFLDGCDDDHEQKEGDEGEVDLRRHDPGDERLTDQ